MVIINNIRSNTLNNNHAGSTTPNNAALPKWNQHLLHLLQQFIEQTPPKQLSRELRSYFMVHIAGYTAIPPNYQDRILQIAAILELLDEIEDKEDS